MPVPYCSYFRPSGRGKTSLRCLANPISNLCAAQSRWPLENVTSGAGGPFAAVVVREGQIVGEGVNTVTARHDPTAHGEVNAIRAACKALDSFSLAGCKLYTSCEPCPMCLAACYWARLDAIYYGAQGCRCCPRRLRRRISLRRISQRRFCALAPRHAVAGRRSLGQLCRMDESESKIKY